MSISNREIEQNGLIMHLDEQVKALKDNVSFWKDRTKEKLLVIEEMSIQILELERELSEYRNPKT